MRFFLPDMRQENRIHWMLLLHQKVLLPSTAHQTLEIATPDTFRDRYLWFILF